jgi:hypothetical protein
MANDAAWLKRVPRAMAEGLTGGRSRMFLVSYVVFPIASA